MAIRLSNIAQAAGGNAGAYLDTTAATSTPSPTDAVNIDNARQASGIFNSLLDARQRLAAF